jgi:biopolymer transport protein TolR
MPKLEELQQTPGRHARRARSMRVSTSLAEINVVPLVDVMLVLLVIFMVTAPMMQQGFGVHLPTAHQAKAVSAPVTVTVPVSYRLDGKVRLGNEAIPIGALASRIRAETDGQLDKSVMVAADGLVTTQELMQVLDKLQEGGINKVGIQSQPPTTERAP